VGDAADFEMTVVFQDMRRAWSEFLVGFSFRKVDGTTVTI
jgi:hypothetical protein